MTNASRRLLILLGSPKSPKTSGSARRAQSVIDGLQERGWETESIQLHAAVRTEGGVSELLEAVDRAEAIVLSAPLYVDSLPGPVMRALQVIAAHRRATDSTNAPRFVSILLCGFLEPTQNATCHQLLELFAARAQFEWMGSLSFGGAGGDGFAGRRIRESLRLLVEAIDEEILLSSHVDDLIGKPSMPRWLYIYGGNAMWKRAAKAHGVSDKLRVRPCEEPADR